jgi:hypothetical protein
MLPIGALRQCENPDEWTRFTMPELRTMMTLWSMMRSPLMIGAEMTKLDPLSLSLITNREVLAINQFSHGGHPLWTREKESVWTAEMPDGTGIYAALFNLEDVPRQIQVSLEQLQIKASKATELWGRRTVETAGKLTADLQPHDAAVFQIMRAEEKA